MDILYFIKFCATDWMPVCKTKFEQTSTCDIFLHSFILLLNFVANKPH